MKADQLALPSARGAAKQQSCEVETIVGFIGYAARYGVTPHHDLVRIFLNCEEKPGSEPPSLAEPHDLRPPKGISFLHAVDVQFDRRNRTCRLRGVECLSAVRKFNRLLGSLAERAREQQLDPNSVFDSAERLLEILGRVKNVREFSSATSGSS